MADRTAPDQRAPDAGHLIAALNGEETTEKEKQTTIQTLSDWLKTKDEQEEGRLAEQKVALLEELSLDLPVAIVGCLITSTAGPGDCGHLMATTISEAEYCLARVVEHGNAKEVFMALTTSVLQRLASSATASEADHDEPPPHELTGHPTTTTPPHPPVFTWPFLRTILSSLSSVLLKIVGKARNPGPFFRTFGQVLLGLLGRCGGAGNDGLELDVAGGVYREMVGVCRAVEAARDADLEDATVLLLACGAALLFAQPHNPLPLQKARLCRRDPKWRASFARLITPDPPPWTSTTTTTFASAVFASPLTDPVCLIQETVKPILADLDACQATHKIARLNERLRIDGVGRNGLVAQLNEFGSGTLGGPQLLRLAQQGALLVRAFGRFASLGQEAGCASTTAGDEVGGGDPEVAEELLSGTFLEASLFVLVECYSSSGGGGDVLTEELAAKVLGLAAAEPAEANRLMMFRSLGCLVAGLESWDARLDLLSRLVHRYTDHPNVATSLVSLLRELLADPARGLLASSSTAPPPHHHALVNAAVPLTALLRLLFDSTPRDLALIDQLWSNSREHHSLAITNLLRFLVERLNLAYLLLKMDQRNLTGIQKGELNTHVKELLVTPVFRWLQTQTEAGPGGLCQNGAIRTVGCFARMALELCIDMLNRT